MLNRSLRNHVLLLDTLLRKQCMLYYFNITAKNKFIRMLLSLSIRWILTEFDVVYINTADHSGLAV
jgi:hypothetical protein